MKYCIYISMPTYTVAKEGQKLVNMGSYIIRFIIIPHVTFPIQKSHKPEGDIFTITLR